MPLASKVLAFVLPAALCLSLAARAALAGEPRFRVVMNWTSESVSPPKREFWNHFDINFAFIGGRQVEERVNNNPSASDIYGRKQTKTIALGDEYAVGRWPAVWRVLDDKTLIRIVAYPTHSWIVRISTDGQSSCTARFEWRLKEGLTEYQGWSASRRTTTRYINPTVRDWRCDILRQT
ncbi:hypothetical protein SAMN04515666_10298 [Bosea lupini]|uniref:Polyketide cyclase / dehydrase and lipid transport n=1 Tax=Bosea lupini TaxID=1036779 RepID=A0A1H7K622_9HYPH|nr:hypothetical protein [Bosea lupini]SEK82279.1 hypothetical protein SAMN04515666_10298 [Bosea lupini]